MAWCAADRVRLLTRNRSDFGERFPLVTQAIGGLPARSCVIDGEITVCDAQGLSVFDLLRHGPRVKHNAVLFAFDLLELDGRELIRSQSKRGSTTWPMLQRARQACSSATTSKARRRRVRACLQARLRGHRIEAARLALSARPEQVLGLDQGKESGRAGCEAGSRGGLGQAEMKKQRGANYEIAVDGTPRSYRVDKQIARLCRSTMQNLGAKLTVRDLTTGEIIVVKHPNQKKFTARPCEDTPPGSQQGGFHLGSGRKPASPMSSPAGQRGGRLLSERRPPALGEEPYA